MGETAVAREAGPLLQLSKDYDLAYQNIDQDNLSALLQYKSEYLSNVKTLLEESAEDENIENQEYGCDSISSIEKEGLELLKALTIPQYMNSIIEQYHQYFSNVKFTYLEQSSKEKFFRNIVNSKFITIKELELLKINTAEQKKMLQAKKATRDTLLNAVNEQLRENYSQYTKIEKLQKQAKETILKSKQMLLEIDKLEKENTAQLETKSVQFDDSDQVLEHVHALDDYEDIVQSTKDDSLITAEVDRKHENKIEDGVADVSHNSSIISNFDDYVILNSTQNLSALVKKRRLAAEVCETDKETVCKKIKVQEEVLQDQQKSIQALQKTNNSLKEKIRETHIKNAQILQNDKMNGKEKLFKNKQHLSSWLIELALLLQRLDNQKGSDCHTISGPMENYSLEMKYGAVQFTIKVGKTTSENGSKYKLSDVSLQNNGSNTVVGLQDSEQLKKVLEQQQMTYYCSLSALVDSVLNLARCYF